MLININAVYVRSPRLGSYKYEGNHPHAKVVADDGYRSGEVGMTFEKITVVGNSQYVVIDNDKLVELKVFLSMVEALNILVAQPTEFWTREKESEMRDFYEKKEADAAAAE
jgi:hypothetical protein